MEKTSRLEAISVMNYDYKNNLSLVSTRVVEKRNFDELSSILNARVSIRKSDSKLLALQKAFVKQEQP